MTCGNDRLLSSVLTILSICALSCFETNQMWAQTPKFEENVKQQVTLKITSEALSLGDLLSCVRANNPAWEIAHAQVEEYRAKLQFAQRSILPSFKFSGSIAPLPARRMLQYCLEENGLNVSPCPNQEINDDQRLDQVDGMGVWTRGQLTVTQPLYTFGKISNGQAAARAGVEAYQAGLDRAEQSLDLQAVQVFYGIQLATQIEKTLKKGLSKLQSLQKKIQKEIDQETGKYTSTDLWRTKIQEGDLVSRLLETQTLKRQATEGIRVACMFSADAKIALKSTQLKPLNGEVLSLDALLDQARTQRYDLQMARAQVTARQALVSKAISDLLPDLALIGVASYSRGTSADNHPDPFANDPFNGFGYGFYFGFNWNLSIAKMLSSPNEARANLRKARAQLRGLEQQIKLELIEQSTLVERHKGTLKAKEEAMRASKQWLTATFINIQSGLISSGQAMNVLKSFAQASVAYDQAVYEYNLALVRLWRATGIDLSRLSQL